MNKNVNNDEKIRVKIKARNAGEIHPKFWKNHTGQIRVTGGQRST